jgi:hypothetical protein
MVLPSPSAAHATTSLRIQGGAPNLNIKLQKLEMMQGICNCVHKEQKHVNIIS